ncbi:rod shape-determining protein MreC [Campylobacter sputorum subsp. bubulus]|uniref:Rod shape-determining protein MreC n=1 Tax=Campylobacter sputorum subsp. sputorum TaxID=32024 RepID=A0A381DLI4_9BACT|nr:rod shape-determining protein MreC [Campylobacter sputorum]ASM34664.1 rod shape-determining protein MreC [Campylobacter sputorum aubsp. sputorum RM3237]ASM36325.1 rod shape-determining protein MreC [Campylobacter sputorum bv. faecalis CCUG 20703]KAB0581122.1 rod shape-determining protein MreC [Campylobacter sputorum subsp. sputorum]QEL04855.1 rod shape-determining protein MreC [Campylobacter sputorum subsp. sputorum]SUX09878.1 rod shape-determining protein MreC [Campylobacter sputorum subsp
MKNKFKLIFLILIFIAISLYRSENARELVVDTNNFFVNIYYNGLTYIKNSINRHFRQANEIKSLMEQNKELEKAANLLSTFADKLNSILVDKNSSIYAPDIKLVKALGYVSIGDYNKIWLEFNDYNDSKIYGLIYQGKTAGIVVSKDKLPMGLLQYDPKSIFSVYVGANKIPGVASGNFKNIVVNFIPQWLNPNVGDEVFTSGLDGIFFSGVPVGKVEKVIEGDLYKSVVVKPYIEISVPSYLYVVNKEN